MSERIRCYGSEKPVVGDLVFDRSSKDTGVDKFDQESLEDDHEKIDPIGRTCFS